MYPSSWSLLLVASVLLLLSSVALGGPMPKTSRCPPVNINSSKYTNRYDKIDIENILKNDRLLKNYIDCLMDRGPCTPEGCLLHEVVPDALNNECSKCSDFQKQQAGRVLTYILQFKRNYWNELVDRYDSDGSIRKKYEFEDD